MNEHPESGELAAYIEGRLPSPERSRLEEHLAECRDCRRQATGAGLLLRGEARRQKKLAGIVIAAAAVVAALFVWTPGDAPLPVQETFRSGSEAAPPSETRIEIVSPGSRPVVSDSVVFSWRQVTEDTLHRLSVAEPTGAPVWEVTTSDTIARPPADVVFEPGGRYLWYVDALLPDGGTATTGVQELRIRPR